MGTSGRDDDVRRRTPSAPAGPIRVMIVDDHPIFRDGLRALIGLHADLTLVAEAEDGLDAVAQHRAHRPDVTVMDLSMPRLDGAAAIAAIVDEHPAARVIALTTYEGDADIYRALEAGARGYLLKDVLRGELTEAIRAVHAGRQVLPAAVAQRLARFTPRVELTQRELEVLAHMADGLRNKDIAEAIGRSEATVKVHVEHILDKLGARDRTEAITVALRRGIIHLR